MVWGLNPEVVSLLFFNFSCEMEIFFLRCGDDYLLTHTFGSKVCDTCWINIYTFHLKCKVNRRVAEIDKSIKKKKKRKNKLFFKVKGFSFCFVK
jgi:hypothetical protein